MGRLLLVGRLALRDLRRRRVEAALLLLAMVAATTTLTLGLVLRDAAGDPYESTRAATDGPDVVASVAPYASERPDSPDGPTDPALVVLDRPAERSALDALAGAPGVVGHGGPYPVAAAELRASGRTSDVQVVGRDAASGPVDRPELTQGGWARPGGVVLEAAFADALDVGVGDPVTLDGRPFAVVGVAVTAAVPPYPGSSCFSGSGCVSGATADELAELPPALLRSPGLAWLTEADVRGLAGDAGSLSYVMSLALADPDGAPAFVEAHLATQPDGLRLQPWQDVRAETTERAGDAQVLLMIGAWLLGLLAVAGVSVLVGGRMADQTRRVGLLKAVGGTPRLVAAVLLAEYVLVALAAAAVGVAVGSVAAPSLAQPGAGLLGHARPPTVTLSTVGLVTAVAVGVAVAATALPTGRAARTSTVHALAAAARPPRRTGWLIAMSAGLPVPLLLALRVAARRPRRTVLAVASVAISVSGIFVALVLDAFLTARPLAGGLDGAQAEQLRQVLVVVMAMVLALAAVNAVVITWATVLDTRQAAALARALGASPREVSAALAGAQVLPALAGAVLGAFPGGFALFHAVNAVTGGDSDRATLPPLGQLLALVGGTVVVVAALTAVPAHLGNRRPVTDALRADHA